MKEARMALDRSGPGSTNAAEGAETLQHPAYPGGSRAPRLTTAAGLSRKVRVIGVQAEGASAAQASWKAKKRVTTERAATFAEGVASRTTYDLAFPALAAGLADFITVTDAEIADAMHLALRTTHTLVEGAGAVGLAGLRKLASSLARQRVAVIFSGANVDEAILKKVLTREI
jgi:threonine dehydratase